MENAAPQQCIILPCTADDFWAVPENALAEILTLPAEGQHPPATVEWRGREIPVLDLGSDADHWGKRHGGTGLIAVLRGLSSSGPEFWGVCLRELGLRIEVLTEEAEDASANAAEYAVGAFRQGEELYQVPDLQALESRLNG
ncbi:hypothetical protein [Parahalioglobus pacificus]|uniref:CheW-like domain-containing protein n=1 Tax=Parahalioglobus pacificus TaxID=930806 RepID=A0A919CLH7_9GAMM|nr:hypothetical protein [Halioglobus pacificus]NQY03830.1 hypothetical protein [Halieaceae bacterium]GHD34711.1 hypothetical protein GCM10007053_20800 [Halioglobus pacificus]